MRVAKLLSLVGVIVWSLTAWASAEDSPIVGAEAKLWNPEASLKFKVSTDEVDGTKIDVEDDLGLDTETVVPYVKVWLGGQQRVSFSAMHLTLDGDADLEEQIVFDGETYSVGEAIKTELTINVYRLAWEADWINTERLRIGTIVGADLFDVTASIESQTTDQKEEGDVQVPVPVVGLSAEIQLVWGFAIYGEIAGLYGQYHDVEGRLIEAEAGLKYNILGYAYIGAGWRHLSVQVETEDSEFDLALNGFVVGLGVRF